LNKQSNALTANKSIKPSEINSEKKQTFDFKIADVPYKIKTSHDAEMVQELTQFVGKKVEEAMKNTKNASFQNAAVLAALNIAEELILLKRRARSELEKLEEKTLRLSLEIDNTKSKKESEGDKVATRAPKTWN
jgi:cell division protein ZapA